MKSVTYPLDEYKVETKPSFLDKMASHFPLLAFPSGTTYGKYFER